MQEEQENQKYFDIDRNLNSLDVTSLVSALIQLDTFLSNLKVRALANTILLRIVTLMRSTSHFYIKNKIRLILSRHQPLFSETALNRTQVINSITYELHATDLLTRLLYLQLITKLASFFRYQISTYHVILGKLASKQKLERREAEKCLKAILSQSKELSRIFVDNLDHISNKDNVQVDVLLRIGLMAKVQPKDYTHMVRVFMGRTKGKWFKKLVMKALEDNYEVGAMFTGEIENDIEEIIVSRYPFIPEAEMIKQRLIENKSRIIDTLKNQSMLTKEQLDFICDRLYEIRHHSSPLQIPTEYLNNLLKTMLVEPSYVDPACLPTLLLCCYYSPLNFDNLIQHRFVNCTDFKLLKILLTLKYERSSKNIIESFLDTELGIGQQRRLLFCLACTDTFQPPESLQPLSILQQFSSYRGQDTLQHLLTTYFLTYHSAITNLFSPVPHPNPSSLLVPLTKLCDSLTALYPCVKPMLDCYISLIEKALIEQSLNLEYLRKRVRKYLPEHCVVGIEGLRDGLMSCVYFGKEVWVLRRKLQSSARI